MNLDFLNNQEFYTCVLWFFGFGILSWFMGWAISSVVSIFIKILGKG